MNNTESKVLEDVAADVSTTEFKKQDDAEEKKTSDNETKQESDNKTDDTPQDEKKETAESTSDQDKEKEEEKKKYELQYAELQGRYEALSIEHTKLADDYAAAQKKIAELTQFKQSIEIEKKDALIDSFYMLSDEDKAEVVANKDKYSLDEIEAKLSVICVRNKVNFDLDKTEKNEDITEDITTYSLQGAQTAIPAWIKAVQNARDKSKLQ